MSKGGIWAHCSTFFTFFFFKSTAQFILLGEGAGMAVLLRFFHMLNYHINRSNTGVGDGRITLHFSFLKLLHTQFILVGIQGGWAHFSTFNWDGRISPHFHYSFSPVHFDTHYHT